MSETDEFVSASSDGFLMDPLTLGSAYQKMKTLCTNISTEVRTDIDIDDQHVLPRFVVHIGKSGLMLSFVWSRQYFSEGRSVRSELLRFTIVCHL